MELEYEMILLKHVDLNKSIETESRLVVPRSGVVGRTEE